MKRNNGFYELQNTHNDTPLNSLSIDIAKDTRRAK